MSNAELTIKITRDIFKLKRMKSGLKHAWGGKKYSNFLKS